MNPKKIDLAIHALFHAQNHLEEYVLDKIVEAKTQPDAMHILAVIQDAEKIQKAISNVLFKLDKLNNISEII